MIRKEEVERATRALVEKGKLIEAGWVGLRIAALPADAPEIQVEEMRNAFFAGARHLLTSIMNILDPGEEPTDADLSRLSLIEDELQAFIADFERRRLPTGGRA